MTTTTTTARPTVTTDQPTNANPRRRTAAVVVSGIVMLGIAAGTTYAFVGRSVTSDQPASVSQVQGTDRLGADAKAFARGTARDAAAVEGTDRAGADAKAFVRGVETTTTTARSSVPASDESGADAVQYAHTHGLSNVATTQPPAAATFGAGHAYPLSAGTSS